MSPMQLRLARTLAEISRAKLAKLSGVSVQTIGNYERGDTRCAKSLKATGRFHRIRTAIFIESGHPFS